MASLSELTRKIVNSWFDGAPFCWPLSFSTQPTTTTTTGHFPALVLIYSIFFRNLMLQHLIDGWRPASSQLCAVDEKKEICVCVCVEKKRKSCALTVVQAERRTVRADSDSLRRELASGLWRYRLSVRTSHCSCFLILADAQGVLDTHVHVETKQERRACTGALSGPMTIFFVFFPSILSSAIRHVPQCNFSYLYRTVKSKFKDSQPNIESSMWVIYGRVVSWKSSPDRRAIDKIGWKHWQMSPQIFRRFFSISLLNELEINQTILFKVPWKVSILVSPDKFPNDNVVVPLPAQ